MGTTSVTAKHFAEAVGKANLAAEVNVELTAVYNAIARGAFPSAWYEAGKRLANGKIDCPPELFNQKFGFKHNSRNVSEDTISQEQVRETLPYGTHKGAV